MKAITILRKMRKLLEVGWTQGTYARNKYGHRVDKMSKSACRFCLSGAYHRVVDDKLDLHSSERTKVLGLIAESIKDANKILFGMPAFNDHPHRTKDEVLAVIDEAISSAYKQSRKPK